MRRDRSIVPARTTSRRDVLLAAGSALALRPSTASSGQSYLALLLRRRAELEQALIGFGDEADRLRAAGASPVVRRRLRRARRAEIQAGQALERLDWVIADTPAEGLSDIALKVRLCAELQGYAPAVSTGWRAPLTAEEQLLRTILADLKRLTRE
jgi:hypothetical protein